MNSTKKLSDIAAQSSDDCFIQEPLDRIRKNYAID